MYCINCGNKLNKEDKFCTSCGEEILGLQKTIEEREKSKPRWKIILVTIFLTSLFWFFYYFGIVNKDIQSANIIARLIETVGRQKQAWAKLEQMIDLVATGFSSECLYTRGCVDEVITEATKLRTEIDKESAEINRIWSENVIGKEFEEYFSNLDEKSKLKIMDVLNLYFPEESEEMETSNKLL